MAELDARTFRRMVQPITLANRNYSKVFGIGANKTGTTSLEAILRLYGLSLPNQGDQAGRLTIPTLLGNYEAFKSYVARFDAFQDQPFSRGTLYVAADCLFPHSKFILTERDPEEWFESLCRYTKKVHKLSDLSSLTEEDFSKHNFAEFRRYNYENMVLTFAGETATPRWDLVFDRDFRIEHLQAPPRGHQALLPSPPRLAPLHRPHAGAGHLTHLRLPRDPPEVCYQDAAPQRYIAGSPVSKRGHSTEDQQWRKVESEA